MATTSLPQTPLFDDALKKAQDAVARLSAVNPDFKACLASNDTIGDVLDSVKSEVDVFKGEKYNKALEQFNKHTQWIHTIQGAVDAAVQINPVATCPIWAPIKLILIVARGQAAAIDLILEIFECLSDDFRRFKLYIGIIDHDSMRSAIFDFFTDILDFSQIAHKHFKKRAVKRTIDAVRRPFGEKYADRIARLRRHAKIVDEIAKAIDISKSEHARFLAAEEIIEAKEERHKADTERCSQKEERLRAEEERIRSELERVRAGGERSKAEEERLNAEQERLQAKQERNKSEKERLMAQEERMRADNERGESREERLKAEMERIRSEEERIRSDLERFHANEERVRAKEERAKQEKERKRAEEEQKRADEERARAREERALQAEERRRAEEERKRRKDYDITRFKIHLGDKLKTCDMGHIRAEQLASLVAGTCDWIWSDEVFKLWLSGHKNNTAESKYAERLLFINGPHGCGKSILAASIAERLRNDKHLVLHFSVSAMDETRNSAESLGRSLFCQLLESKDSSTMLTVDFMETFALSPTPAQIWEGIKRLSRSLEVTAYCVIDGIDEAGDWADKLSLHVAELLESCKRLKLILLGRPASLRFLDDSIALTSIEMSSEVIKTSLQIFLHAKIKSVPVVMNAGEDSAGLQQLVVKCLQQKADGMFLWADLMVKDLYSYNSTAGVREAMLSLPTGLAGLYTRLLEKLVGRTNDLDLERFQKTMTLLTMARRPLTEAELNHAFAVLEHSASAQPTDFKSHHTFGLEAVVRRICGDFVAIKSGTVQLVHISVQEFFTETGAHSPNTSSSNSPIFRRFRVDPAAGHMLYVNLSLDYWAVADEALEKNSSTDTQKGDIEISTTEYVDPYAHIHELYPLMGYVSTHFLFHAKHMIDQTFPRSMIDKLRAFIKSKIFFSTLEGILLECLDYDPEILLAFIIRCRAVVRPTGWDAYFAAVFDSDIQRLVRKLLQSIGPLAPEIIMVSHQQELHRRTSLYGPYHLRTVRVFWVGVILKYVLDEFQRMGGWAEAVVVEVAERTSRIISTISTFVDACDGFLRRKPKTESPPCGLEALPLEFKQANWRTFREIDEAMDYIQSTKDLETPNSTSKRLDLLTLVVQLLALVSYGRRLRDEKQFNRLCSLIRDNFRLLPTPVIFEVGSSLYGYHQSKERFERAGEMFHLAQKSMGRTDSYLYGVIQAHYALSHWKRRAASLSINKNSVSTDSAREQAIVCARQASSIIRKYQLPEAVYYSYQIFYDLASFWVMVNGDANDNHLEETHRALSALWEDEQLFGELLLKWETAQGIQGIVDKLWEVHFASHRFEELRNVLQRIQKRVEGAGNKRAANDHRLFFPLGIVTILCGHLVEGKRLLWKAVRCILTHAELDGLSDPNLQLESMARRLKRDTESIDEPRLRRRVFEEIYETRMSKFFRFCMGIIKTFCMDNMFAEASILSDQVAGAWRSLFPTDLEEIGGNAPMAAKNNVYCYRNWGRHINAKLTLAFIHLLQGHEYTAVSLFREIIDVDTRTSYGDIFGTASTSRDHLAIIIFRRGEFREAELLFTDVDYDQCNYKQLGTIARLWGHLVSHWDDHDLPRYTPMPGLLRALNCESLMDRFNTHKEGLRRKEPMHKFCPPEDEVIQGVEHMVAIGYTGIATKFDKVLKKFYLEQIEKKRARRIEYEKLHAYDDPDSRSRYKPTSSLQGWDREKALGLFRQ